MEAQKDAAELQALAASMDGGSGDLGEEAPRLLLLYLSDPRRAGHASAASARTFMLCQVGRCAALAVDAGVPAGRPAVRPTAQPARVSDPFLACLPACPPLPLQAFAEEVTNLVKQGADAEQLQAKLLQVCRRVGVRTPQPLPPLAAL